MHFSHLSHLTAMIQMVLVKQPAVPLVDSMIAMPDSLVCHMKHAFKFARSNTAYFL